MEKQSSADGSDGWSFSRRSILKGAGAVVFLSAMPWDTRKVFASQPFDVIVIGGCTAGIPTAIFAADRGALVLIIEKASQVGGTLYMSHGEMAAANTVFQKQRLGRKI